jgi:predicted dienelactone hydrolase
VLAGCGDADAGASSTAADTGGPTSTATDTASGGTATSASASASSGATDTGDSTAATTTTTGTTGAEPPTDFLQPGPFAVVHGTFELDVADGGQGAPARTLPVQVWQPSVASAGGATPLAELEPPGARRDALTPLVAAGPPGCVRTPVGSSAGAATPPAGPRALVVMSHCYACLRIGKAFLAERLASHGIVVAAPEHVGNSLYDALAGDPGNLDEPTLLRRVADVQAVTDALLAGQTGELAVAAIDPARIGLVGHSFGASTVGLALATDPRYRAGYAIAAPIVTFGGITPADITQPVFLLRALEDNSIGAFGNNTLQAQQRQLAGPSWLADVSDAGHWSFTDIAGLTEDLEPGCGDATRQTVPGEPFSYLDNDRARAIAAGTAARFFAAHLLADADALTALAEPFDPAMQPINALPGAR